MENDLNLSQKSPQELCSIILLLQQEKLTMVSERDHYKDRYDRLLEQLKLARLKQFGQSSETSEQLKLFDEADQPLPKDTQETIETDELSSRSKKRKKRQHKPLPPNLPVEEIVHDINASEKQCDCGHTRHRIGESVTEQLKYIPAQLIIVRHIRPKYGCRACEDGIKIAPMPRLLLPKSMATPELVAHVILSKYEDHIPLYRQEQQWKRLGIDLPRHSCCAWLMKVAELCEPLYDLLKADLLTSPYIQADETPVLVLKLKQKKKRQKSYIWVYRSHPPNKPSVIYVEYQPGRSGRYAAQCLEGFKGYLQTDMYQGYNFIDHCDEITHVGCMAHTRRYFADIVKTNKTPGLAHQALKFFKALYKIERQIKHESIEKRYEVRQKKSRRILNCFKRWLEKSIQQVPDGFAIGKAIHYSLDHWDKLIHYTHWTSRCKFWTQHTLKIIINSAFDCTGVMRQIFEKF